MTGGVGKMAAISKMPTQGEGRQRKGGGRTNVHTKGFELEQET